MRLPQRRNQWSRGYTASSSCTAGNLRRSGRIGTAASWLGTALALKPLLRIDGRVSWCSCAGAHRIQSGGRDGGAGAGGGGERRAALAVHHVANPDGAADVAATCRRASGVRRSSSPIWDRCWVCMSGRARWAWWRRSDRVILQRDQTFRVGVRAARNICSSRVAMVRLRRVPGRRSSDRRGRGVAM